MTEGLPGGRDCPVFPKNGKRAVVLCDGPPRPMALLNYWLDGADLFVCADGAGHPYTDLPREPDLIIGDMDSLDWRVVDGRDGPRFLHDGDQQTTDSEKALAYLANEGYSEVVLAGAVGWRLDHTLYNCLLLEKFSDSLRLCIVGYEAEMIRVAAGDHIRWNLAPGTVFSLLPIYGRVTGVTVEGARWPIDNVDLDASAVAAISNEVLISPLQIEVDRGSLLATVSRAGWYGA